MAAFAEHLQQMIGETVVTVVCAPILILQALALRRRALRLPEADGRRSGTLGSGPSMHLLIVGDSSAAGVGVPTQDMALAGQLTATLARHFTIHWTLRARTGITTRETLDVLRGQHLPRVDIAVVVLGVNDVTRMVRLSQWLRDHGALRALLREAGAQRLYISQVPPLGAFPLLPHPLRWLLGRRALRFDAALHHALGSEANSYHVPLPDTLDPADMAEDGFHPGATIYAAWAKEMARGILSDGPS